MIKWCYDCQEYVTVSDKKIMNCPKCNKIVTFNKFSEEDVELYYKLIEKY